MKTLYQAFRNWLGMSHLRDADLRDDGLGIMGTLQSIPLEEASTWKCGTMVLVYPRAYRKLMRVWHYTRVFGFWAYLLCWKTDCNEVVC